jgi:hypothetical protein
MNPPAITMHLLDPLKDFSLSIAFVSEVQVGIYYSRSQRSALITYGVSLGALEYFFCSHTVISEAVYGLRHRRILHRQTLPASMHVR